MRASSFGAVKTWVRTEWKVHLAGLMVQVSGDQRESGKEGTRKREQETEEVGSVGDLVSERERASERERESERSTERERIRE